LPVPLLPTSANTRIPRKWLIIQATSFLIARLYSTAVPRYRRIEVYPPAGSAPASWHGCCFVDPSTGWIVENFDASWRPDWRDWQKQAEGTIGVVGHNFQAAWLLVRAADLTVATADQARDWRQAAATVLRSMLSKATVVDRDRGGVGDVYVRETDQPMWHTNKPWWQQAEAILALRAAERAGLDVPGAAEVRRSVTDFYLANVIDRRGGGEFAVVDRDGAPVQGERKGHAGKSTYHAVELARFMKAYGDGTRQSRPQGTVTCPACHGSGWLVGGPGMYKYQCPTCHGTGTVQGPVGPPVSTDH